MRIDHSKSHPTEDNRSLKGAWSHHVTHFKFVGPKNISGMAKARDFIFCTLVGHVKVKY